MRQSLLILAVLSVPSLAGVADAQPRVDFVVQAGPPAPRSVYTDARDGYVWVQGRWRLDAGRWLWADGYWQRQRPGYVWVDGYWDTDAYGQYVWVEGYWEPMRVGYEWSPGRWDWRGERWCWTRGTWLPARAGYAYRPGRWIYASGRPVWYQGGWAPRREVVRYRNDVYVRQGAPRVVYRNEVRNQIRNDVYVRQPAPRVVYRNEVRNQVRVGEPTRRVEVRGGAARWQQQRPVEARPGRGGPWRGDQERRRHHD